MLDNEYFLPAEQLSEALTKLGMLQDGRVITYCGGGIAATIDAFACKLLGQHDVAVYDGSMSAWVQSPDRALTLREPLSALPPLLPEICVNEIVATVAEKFTL